MQSHGPKRFYTPQSLEFWFERLAGEWSAIFTLPQLEEGRRIYRDGEVRELELTDRDAIVHRRIEKKDEYAVIEWPAAGAAYYPKDRLEVRLKHASGGRRLAFKALGKRSRELLSSLRKAGA